MSGSDNLPKWSLSLCKGEIDVTFDTEKSINTFSLYFDLCVSIVTTVYFPDEFSDSVIMIQFTCNWLIKNLLWPYCSTE